MARERSEERRVGFLKRQVEDVLVVGKAGLVYQSLRSDRP
jgi:hypothetical protein